MIFSIIIPVYNVEIYLRECLDSVLNQGLESCELICVNDGSTDGSLTILEEYVKKYPQQLKLFSQPNAGLSAARNKGISEANGEYLLFLDSDDMLNPGSLELLAAEIKHKNVDIVAFNSELLYNSNQNIEPNTSFNHSENQLFETGMCYFDKFVLNRGWGPSAVCFYAFRRSLLVDNHLKFEIGLLHEDELFLPLVLFYASKTMTINKSMYIYRKHEKTITGRQANKNHLDKIQIAQDLYEFFLQKEMMNNAVKRSIYNLSLAGIHGLMNSKLMIPKQTKKTLYKVATTSKKKLISLLIIVDIRLYRLYFQIIK